MLPVACAAGAAEGPSSELALGDLYHTEAMNADA